MKQTTLFSFILGATVLLLVKCTNSNSTQAPGAAGGGGLGTTRGGVITPVDFPKLDIQGFAFPQDSNVINGWIHSDDTVSQYKHGWGIWVGLNQLTDQKGAFDDSLRVFETWRSPSEIIDIMQKGPLAANNPGIRSNRANLSIPNQFKHGRLSSNITIQKVSTARAYSPAAEAYVLNNKIFSGIQLYDYAQKGSSIPSFPNNAIILKPTYVVLHVSEGATFSLSVWPPVDTTGYPNKIKGYKMTEWGNSVQIDTKRTVSDPANKIFALNDFIYYKMNKEDADAYNAAHPSAITKSAEGDFAVLVAMHVMTREIANWTWETFWWVPDADNPASPSSKAIADVRPTQLKGAARHYAMSVSNYMVNPNEPIATSDKVIGKLNLGFNPYLEASFSGLDPANSKIYTKNGTIIPTSIGIRSNCMSCHRLAAVNLTALVDDNKAVRDAATPDYVGDSYISRTNPVFKDKLLVGFAWSIIDNLDTTGLKAYIKSYKK